MLATIYKLIYVQFFTNPSFEFELELTNRI